MTGPKGRRLPAPEGAAPGTDDQPNVPAFPIGMAWNSEALIPPTITIEISFIELEYMIVGNDEAVKVVRASGSDDLVPYYEGRASFLRQRLAEIAPHRLHPETSGSA